jgi:transcriptional regulator with XRE-family HTH domain
MINEKIIEDLREYLKDNYFPPSMGIQADCCCFEEPVFREASLRDVFDDVSDYIKTHREPEDFAHALDRIRKEKGLSPAELYKKANVDRRQYSRFMGPEGRHPSMNTAVSFALALRLNRQEFDKFLQTAGYALSNSSSRDVCVMFCLEKGIYEIDEVNALLFAIGIDPLTRDTPV